jgi:AmmeMemoRadiSam system protein B
MLRRAAAVAGSFYPGEAPALARMLQRLVQPHWTREARPKALIAPHAGYVYSGPVAASAYGALAGRCADVRRVVLLGPSHHVPLAAIAVPTATCFATPLGDVPVDRDALAALRELHHIVAMDEAHLWEHSLEVQLPFLQTLLADFALVPLVVGRVAPQQVAEVLECVWGGAETLIVVSSDLSHYLGYDQACRVDAATSRKILALETSLVGEQACGCHALNGLLCAARRRGMRIEQLDLRNSGDTAGPRDRVVGYGAYALYDD